MQKLLAVLIALPLLFSLSAPPVQAVDYQSFDVFDILDVEGDAGSNTSLNETIQKDATSKGVSVAEDLILRGINILSLLVGTFAFIMIIIGGFFMITANGEENKIDRGKNILIQAILGVVIAFLAYFIVVFIQSLLY